MAQKPHARDPRDVQYRIRAVRRDPTDLGKFARGLLRLVEAQELTGGTSPDDSQGGLDGAS